VGTKTLFQQTVDRVVSLQNFAELIVITGRNQLGWVRQQLHDTGQSATIILEPKGRDSAPAVAVAAHHVHRKAETGIVVLVASDHHIVDRAKFGRDIQTAVNAAAHGQIVTLGIRPDSPNPAYGYIQPQIPNAAVSPVDAFVEKPTVALAKKHIEDGFLWNSGNFIAMASTLLNEFSVHAPDVLEGTRKALDAAQHRGNTVFLGTGFAEIPKISMDYAIMEKTKHASVVATDLAWSDLGAWDAVHDALPHDAKGNAVHGNVVIGDSSGCHIRAGNRQLVVVSGMDDVNIIVEDDVILVSDLNKAQAVKALVDQMEADGRKEIDVENPVFDLPYCAATMEKWLAAGALPLWWTIGLDRKTGLWRESLTRDGCPTDEKLRARVQGRQTYCYGLAATMGWAGPAREAIQQGLDTIARNSDANGMLPHLVDVQGAVIDDSNHLYDQTFVLLALAAANDHAPGQEKAALLLLDNIEREFGLADAGFREAGRHPYQSNAHMHLFEAALAWIDTGKNPRWRALAEDIAAMALNRFVDPQGGFVREFFDENWHPLDQDGGQMLEPGHQFEWAWLLARWYRLTGAETWLQTAHRLFDCGLSGIDPARGVAVDFMDTRLQPTTGQARLWHQTEWLQAALLLHDIADGPEKQVYLFQASRAHAALNRYLDKEIAGLWHDKVLADNSFVDEHCPASSFYHIVTAVMQMRESAAKTRKCGQAGGTGVVET